MKLSDLPFNEDAFHGRHIDDIFVLLVNFQEAIITEVVHDSGNAFGLLKDFGNDIVGKKGIGSAGDF